MTRLTYRQHDEWPGDSTPTAATTTSRFTAHFDDTRALLEAELDHLGATDATVALVGAPDLVRRDGQRRTDRKVLHPGVIVEATTRDGDLSLRADHLRVPSWHRGTEHWRHNLRAVALTLEALRAVERHGVVRGQQYSGLLALDAAGAGADDVAAARRVLESYGGVGIGAVDSSDDETWRRARRAAHPDRHGGLRSAWDAVEAAAHTLGLS